MTRGSLDLTTQNGAVQSNLLRPKLYQGDDELAEKVWRAVCHDYWWQHLDEMFSIWLIEVFGQDRFPGLKLASTLILGKDFQMRDKSAAQWEEEGYLFVGVGGGRLDDHGRHGKAQGKSAAQLIVNELGTVNKFPALGGLLAWVNTVDTMGPKELGDIGYALLGIEDRDEAISFARVGFKSVLMRRHKSRFDSTTKRAFERGKVIKFRNQGGTSYQVRFVTLPQGLDSVSALAFDDSSSDDILVQTYPTGHVSLRAHPKKSVDLKGIWQVLTVWDRAKQTGKVWHREQRNGVTKTIVNGGRTHACIVPATLMSQIDIQRAIIFGLETDPRVVAYRQKIVKEVEIDS